MPKKNQEIPDVNPFENPAMDIEPTRVSDEIEQSFLEYSYSVIYARALPDARDGLKPVHRRILYTMVDSGYTPDKPHVKSARIVGACFAKGALVHTPDGLRPIESMSVGDPIITPEGVISEVSKVFKFENSKMVRVSYADGSHQDVTSDQLIEVVNDDYSTEWVEAQHASGRVSIGAKNNQNITFVEPNSSAAINAYIVGLFIAEGSGDNKGKDRRSQISMTDPECIEYVDDYMSSVGVYTSGIKVVEQEKFKTQHHLRVSYHEDVYQATRGTASTKKIPLKLLEQLDIYAPLLAGLWDGDGYLRDQEGISSAVYTTVSRELAQQVYAMLNRIGIRSSISEYKDSINSKLSVINGREIKRNFPLIQVNVLGIQARNLSNILAPYLVSERKKEAATRIASQNPRYAPSKFTMLPSGYIFEEFSNYHLGGGWFKNQKTGEKFRMALDEKGNIRYGKSMGLPLSERQLDLPKAIEKGWLDKLELIGSPLAPRLKYLSDRFFMPVVNVESLPDSDSYDVEIADERHAFVVEGKSYHNCMGIYHPHGDCLSADTIIVDANGIEYSIGYLAENDSRIAVTAVDEAGNIVNTTAHSFRIGQEAKQIFVITLANGHVVKATSNHPFLSVDGNWVKAIDVTVGTLLVGANYDPAKRYMSSAYHEVVNVEIEEHRSPVPMFDFTVDSHENLMIAHKLLDGSYSFLVAHNSAIYESMVRLAQPFNMRIPLVDGHGNFGGTPDDKAASSRYTESRLSKEGLAFIGEIKEEAVPFGPNFDGSTREPKVLPATFPNLLINGTSGIAVGMATNMAPHNPDEVISAVKHLIKHEDATIEDLMQIIKGPDFPSGGTVLAGDSLKAAYTDGKGIIKIRAKTEIEELPGGKGKIIVTEAPYQVGFEKVISDIKDEITKKRIQGISRVVDLTDRRLGTYLQIETKSGYSPATVLALLYKYTQLEVSFGIQNLALVGGKPVFMSLKDMLQVFIEHRREVITNRSLYRKNKKESRLHLINGLMLILADIDKAIKIVRNADDATAAKTQLSTSFKIDDVQSEYILSLQLRRLTKYDTLELTTEKNKLEEEVAALAKILADSKELDRVLVSELDDILKLISSERRSVIIEQSQDELASVSVDNIDQESLPEVTLYMDNKGNLSEERAKLTVDTVTFKGTFLGITADGVAHRMRQGDQFPNLIALAPDNSKGNLVVGTKKGVVKVVAADYPSRQEDFPIISLEKGDSIVGARWVEDATKATGVFISSDASLLAFPVSKVRAQGRNASGVAGMDVLEGQSVLTFGVSVEGEESLVTTYTGTSVKTTPLSVFPVKGRGGKGMRSHKFLKGEESLTHAVVGTETLGVRASKPVKLPEATDKRDGSGEKIALQLLLAVLKA